jgi:hypothetical protein
LSISAIELYKRIGKLGRKYIQVTQPFAETSYEMSKSSQYTGNDHRNCNTLDENEGLKHISEQQTVNCYKLPFLEFEKTMTYLKKIKGCEVTENELIDDLCQLHSRGLIIYFSQSEHLREFIFSDIKQFASVMKMLFNHNQSSRFSYEELNEELKEHPYMVSKSKYDELRSMLEKKGFMSYVILKNISLHIGISLKTLVTLLTHLRIAHPLNDTPISDEPDMIQINYILFPFYINNESEIRHVKVTAAAFSIQTQFVGSFPASIFNTVIVLLYQEYFVHFQTSEVKFHKNRINCDINDIKVDICIREIHDNDVIDIILECPVRKVSKTWKMWKELCSIMDKLKDTWWDEIFSDQYVMCKHCQQQNAVNTWHIPIDTVKESTSLEVEHCDRTGDRIPALLIHPPRNGEGILFI